MYSLDSDIAPQMVYTVAKNRTSYLWNNMSKKYYIIALAIGQGLGVGNKQNPNKQKTRTNVTNVTRISL
jgi:hypothetical protein